MKKLLIMGYSGSGKTTLAAKLGQALECKVIYIDDFQFTETFDMQDQQKVFSQIDETLHQQDRWIIDGYISYYIEEKWLEAADCILFLNFSRWRCLIRLVKRSLSRRHPQGKKSPQASQTSAAPVSKKKTQKGSPHWWWIQKSQRYLWWIFCRENKLRKQRYYLQAGERHPQKFVEVRTPKQLEAFLSSFVYGDVTK